MRGTVRFDCYDVDLPAGQLYKHGRRVALRDKSFQLLAALLEHPGEVVTRDDLRRRLWGEDVFVDFENNLNTAVARLREALGDSADRPLFIETLPKRGYRFLASVSEPPRAPDPGRPVCVRLVVLPFVNLTGDTAQEYFSDAMTDEIITALVGIAPGRLAVIARTTAMHYKGSRKDVTRIGRELAVDYVVEGAVRRDGCQIGINVQLVHATDQTHLYAKKHEATLENLFETQQSIACDIAARIMLPRVSDDTRPVSTGGRTRRPTDDLDAYDAYIRGRHLFVKSPEAIARAKACFDDAIARDPHFALAYDALGEVYWWMGFTGLAPPREAFSAGVFRALRALEIDGTLGEAHALLGVFRKELDYDWPEVQREMAIALRCSPASPLVGFRNAISWLMPQGRLAEAVSEMQRVLEYDPLDLHARCWLGIVHWLGGQYDRAMEQARMVLDVDPAYSAAHLVVGQIRTMERRFDEALAALRTAVELYGGAPLTLGWLGLALAGSGDTSEAQALLGRLRAIASSGYVPATDFAWTYLGLGEVDEALIWMDRAIDERDPMMIPIKSYPFLDPLRGNLRFHALMRKMNLIT